MNISPILMSDSYKQNHYKMYPKGLEFLYSNMTPRSYKFLGCDKSVFFGLQYYIKEYLMGQWNTNFFQRPLDEVIAEYKRFHKNFSFCDIDVEHIEKLHNLGYLPIKIKALPEGTLVPAKIPYYTIINTHSDHAWLVNFLETQMSTVIWDFCVNATIAKMYRDVLNDWAIITTGSIEGVQWQGHDFSMRGRASIEGTYANAGHLLSFTGTDTIPAVMMLEKYYNAIMENELVGSSVPATEHSVMTSYGKENEIDAFKRIIFEQFPTGMVSVVSDSFDLWKVCTEFMVELKQDILQRNGKVILRPDSGDPVDILCGEPLNHENYELATNKVQAKGVVELLWDVFGGTINEKGYKVLDSHIGVIYGDSITLERAENICYKLEQKGFASTNVVLGIGSYTYNYNTRDTLGIAVKSTWCQVNGEERNIFKDPVTDNGLKKSAKGLLRVGIENGEYILYDEQTHDVDSCLKIVYSNGHLYQDWTLSEIRETLQHQ